MIKQKLFQLISRFVFPNKGITHIKRSPRLIVSLTSWPGRIGVVENTVDSLLRQSIKADQVVLWLEESKFPHREKSLPKTLRRLCKYGLTIKWYSNDIRSYCKLVPQIKENPDAIIVTADDDVLYPENWLESLYVSYVKYPNQVHCHHAYTYYVNKDDLIVGFLPYQRVGLLEKSVIPMGVGGILYPPGVFHEDIDNEILFTELAPTNDDFWFWAMTRLKKTPARRVDACMDNIVCIENTQEGGLWMSENSLGKGSDQFKNIINHYPELRTQLLHK